MINNTFKSTMSASLGGGPSSFMSSNQRQHADSVQNTNLYSRRNRLEGQNQIKFRCRVDSQEGKDVHRDFTGVYYPRWRALYLDELKLVLGQYKTIPMYPFDVYLHVDPKTDEENYYFSGDFKVGETLSLGLTKSTRERAPKRYVITEVDESSLFTPTESIRNFYQHDRNLPKDVVDDIVRIRDAYIARAGGAAELGIKDMGRRFRVIDASGDRKVSLKDFAQSVRDVQLDIPASRVQAVFAALDTSNDGSISYEELLNVMRGPMSERRRRAVQVVFRKLDTDGSGTITLQEIRSKYNADGHPDVKRGTLTSDQVMQGFLATWDTRDKNGVVTFAEFCDYYSGISALVDEDELFEAIIFSSWRVIV